MQCVDMQWTMDTVMHSHCRNRVDGVLKPPINNIGWMTVVAPTDRPCSVRNRSVIDCVKSLHFSLTNSMATTILIILLLNILSECFSLLPELRCLNVCRVQEESIHWLLVNNRISEAERVVRRAANMNKVNYDEILKKLEQMKKEKSSIIDNTDMTDVNADTHKEGIAKDSRFKVKKYNLLYLFRERTLLVNSLILWFAW